MCCNTNSSGVPTDQDGEPLEFGVIGRGVAPFAVREDIFRELFMEPEPFKGPHLESEPLGQDVRSTAAARSSGAWTHSSLVGGIPIERVEIEDVDEGYQSEESEPPIHKSGENLTSDTVHAILKTTKHERDELFSTRRKLQDALSFLRGQGFSEEQVLAQSLSEGFGHKPLVRDEFGLPVIQACDKATKPSPNPFKDKMKGKVDLIGTPSVVDEVLEEKAVKAPAKEDSVPEKSWSQVVNNSSPVHHVKFEYFPKSVGASVISPPREVLKQGNEKFKNCLVGTFSKGYLPYAKVKDFAIKNWTSKGFVQVSQKDNLTFIFKFKEQNDVMSVLARGTWFIDRRPLLVHLWGTSGDVKQHLPLWVRFEKIPDCYWTKDGLSWLASSIGTPLCADANTSKLEVLPYAKMCVNYKIGDELPSTLDVEVLDPVLEEITISQVLVSYPAKPLVCSACKSLGHLIGACPRTVRQWVRKEKDVQPPPADNLPAATDDVPVVERGETLQDAHAPSVIKNDSNQDSGWTEVKRKKDAVMSDASPSPPVTFKNLRNVDEIDKRKGAPVGPLGSARLTKTQKKKLRLLKGSSPPPNSAI